MASTHVPFSQLSHEELLREVPRLAGCERHATAALVAALAEMDERKLHVREGYSSLFAYCTGRLRFSEAAACRRIDAARASRRFPTVLVRLSEGTLTLAAIGMLARHLTPANHVAVLDAARHRSKRDLEELVARIAPRPDVASSIRKLPSPTGREATGLDQHRPAACLPSRSSDSTTADTPVDRQFHAQAARAGDFPSPMVSANTHQQATPPSLVEMLTAAGSTTAVGAATVGPPLVMGANADRLSGAADERCASACSPAPRRAIVRPLAPARYQVQVTVSAETHAKLLRARDLLRHAIPNGDPALILDRALTVLLERLERAKFAASKTDDGGRQPRGNRPGTGAATPGDVRAASVGAAPPLASSTPPRSRYLPAPVRREVWGRSQGRCEFVAADGHRCEERGFLEFHHRVPFASGGASSTANVALHCKAHNQHEAELHFGAEFVEARRACGKRAAASATGAGPLTPTEAVVSPSPATVEGGGGSDGDRRGSPVDA
jgi:hypothetical protein